MELKSVWKLFIMHGKHQHQSGTLLKPGHWLLNKRRAGTGQLFLTRQPDRCAHSSRNVEGLLQLHSLGVSKVCIVGGAGKRKAFCLCRGTSNLVIVEAHGCFCVDLQNRKKNTRQRGFAAGSLYLACCGGECQQHCITCLFLRCPGTLKHVSLTHSLTQDMEIRLREQQGWVTVQVVAQGSRWTLAFESVNRRICQTEEYVK